MPLLLARGQLAVRTARASIGSRGTRLPWHSIDSGSAHAQALSAMAILTTAASGFPQQLRGASYSAPSSAQSSSHQTDLFYTQYVPASPQESQKEIQRCRTLP